MSISEIKSEIKRVLKNFRKYKKGLIDGYEEDIAVAKSLCKELNETGNFKKEWSVKGGKGPSRHLKYGEDEFPIYSHKDDYYKEPYFLIHCHGNEYTVTLENDQ